MAAFWAEMRVAYLEINKLFADFTPYVLFIDMGAMMVGRQGHRT